MWSGKIVLLLLWLVEVVVGTRGGGSCAAARKCCDGKDPDCAVPSVSEEDASKRHGEKRKKTSALNKLQRPSVFYTELSAVYSAVCFAVACDL